MKTANPTRCRDPINDAKVPFKARTSAQGQRGTTALEWALVLPVLLALVLGVLYTHELLALGPHQPVLVAALQDSFIKAFAALLLLSGVGAWWMVLTQQSRQVGQEESNRQTQLLIQQMESHQRTDEALQKAKPASSKGQYLRKISLTSTMGAGIRVDQASLSAQA